MALNNFENKIQEEFNKRTIEPSSQAWDRLDAMLTVAEENKPKRSLFWLQIAASLILFFGVGYFILNQNFNEKEIHKNTNEIVTTNSKVNINNTNTKNSNPANPITNHEAVKNIIFNNSKNLASNNSPKDYLNANPIQDETTTISETINKIKISNSIIENNYSTTTLEKTKPSKSYAYITPEKLLAEVEGKKETNKPDKYKSSITVNADDLLDTAEHELNESFKEKALHQYNKVKTTLSNRNLE